MANVTTDAQTNLIKAAQMAKVREVDFVSQFTHNSLAKLLEVLGVTRKVAMMEGTTLYVYKTSGTLQSGAVAEGEIIPLSQYTTTKEAVGEITLNKWRKAVSAEAIKKSGYEAAVRDTDAALLKDVQAGLRTSFFSFINGTITGETSVIGEDLQSALAAAWGQLQVKFEDDSAEAVYFVNPLDAADYLKKASITTQTVFGLNYVQDFLGLGTLIMSSRITQGTIIATAKQNLILYYLTMNGDVADAFELTADETGYIGISSGHPNKERAQIESLVMDGITLLVDYAAGVVKGVISGELIDLEVTSVAGATSGKTAVTYTGYTPGAGESVVYKITDDPILTHRGDSIPSSTSSYTAGTDITATTGKIINLFVKNASDKVVASGYTTVTSKA